MDKRDLARNEPCDENVVAVGELVEAREDLLSARMTPPRASQRFTCDDADDARQLLILLKKESVAAQLAHDIVATAHGRRLCR